MSVHIRLKDVSLSVPIYLQKERVTRGWASTFIAAALDPPKRKWTQLLCNINLDINEGDRVAILGRNGAGKSTMLRILNGVYTPTSGRVDVVGSRQALLNISLGFNGGATLRENILLRGTAMNLSSDRLLAEMDSILDFAGLAMKANHRLHTLSSGQRMRLGFAISTAFQHDIMLMDEWVGAGDSDFMAKATERMQSRVSGSKIVVLASHSVSILRKVCNKGIVLEKGRLVHQGDIVSSLDTYHRMLSGDLDVGEDVSPPRPEELVVQGYVESAAMDGDELVLIGWSADVRGAIPDVLSVELASSRIFPTRIDRVRRPDVASYLGLSNDGCGFVARFDMADFLALPESVQEMVVRAGQSSEDKSVVLQMTEAAKLAMASFAPVHS